MNLLILLYPPPLPPITMSLVALLSIVATASPDAAAAAAIFASIAVIGPGRRIIGIATATTLLFWGVLNNAPSPAMARTADAVVAFLGRGDVSAPLPPAPAKNFDLLVGWVGFFEFMIQ